ncbi:hypothetical protein PLICRDRAFT_38680 [Plicaturopsis crispa FD-325 SS-3]|nr:hypothetical protein PLICRDRAFT_38680 [Plicaturopsis crispa FD-325 SS-3]
MSSTEPRSPLYGTATYSTLSPTDTPMSPSRLGTTTSYHSDATSDTYYNDDNSIDDAAEVEAALSNLDDEFDRAEGALTEWSSRGSSSGYTPTTSYASTGLGPFSNMSAAERVRLSTITERTENTRPTSHAFSAAMRATPASPSRHSRSSSEVAPPPGRRAGDLIAFFEDRSHSRNASAPSGPRSPSPYRARSASPTKTFTSSSVSGPRSMSSLLSPPLRAPTTLSATTGTGYMSPSTYTYTTPSTFPSTNTNTFTNTFTASSNVTPTASLRRPQTSPRSPLTSVRNIVAAWKERTPTNDRGDGLFSVRRRASRGGARLRESALAEASARSPPQHDTGGGRPMTPSGGSSSGGMLPPPFDISELGAYSRGSAEPLRIGLLWYLNVHAPPPYRWVRCQALLYPHMVLLSWIAPGGGRGVVTLDLLNCTEVRSVPSPTHISARDDVGTVAAREQDGGSLMELLCPFQLLYTDGVERLAAESARERVRWVSAIWEALDRSVTMPGSPTGSIRTIRSMTSSHTQSVSDSGSASGSASTVFVPPSHTLPDISDLESSFSGSSSTAGLTRRTSLASAHHTRAADDASVSNQTYLYPGDPRVIAPSRSSSLRRTSSLTDLDEEFASAVSRARNARPGLGFGLGLVGGTIPLGEGSPVTMSSGPRLNADVRLTPPPRSRSRASGSISDDAFFTAGSGSNTDTRSSYYSGTGVDTRTTTITGTRSGTGMRSTDGTILDLTSGGSDTHIVASSISYRNTESASMLGDSHDSSESYTRSYSPSSSPSRSALSRMREVRRRVRSATSRTYSSGYPSGTEDSDKENSGTYSGTRSYTDDYDGCYTTESTGFTRSTTPSYPSYPSSYTRSERDRDEEPEEEERDDDSSSEPYVSADSGTSHYSSAKSTSSKSSYKSFPTIPSESEYETAEVCSTEYTTVPPCSSTEYSTAELCPTEHSTEYWTAEPKDIPSERSTPRSSIRELEESREELSEGQPTPSVVPTIPSSFSESELSYLDIDPRDIPLPPSEGTPSVMSSVLSPSLSTSSGPWSVERPSTIPPASSPSSGPSSDLLLPTATISSSSRTESSELTPTELTPSELTPTVPSSEGRTSPSIHPSLWAAETDESYESSQLAASPSVGSLALQEGQDTSFETSFMRPSASSISSLDRLTPITESITESISEPSIPLPSPIEISEPSSMTPTSIPMPSSPSSSSEASSSTPSSLSRTPSSISAPSGLTMPSSEEESSYGSEIPSIREPSTEPSLLSSARSPLPRLPSSPALVPLPGSPSMSARSVSMSVSVSTPHSALPSVHSALETVVSEEARSELVTREITRILETLHEMDQRRGNENRDLAGTVQDIRDELYDLSDYLRRPPPVPKKDRSVGGSVVGSVVDGSDRGSIVEGSIAEEPVREEPVEEREVPPQRPAGPRELRVQPHLVPIPLTPPPFRVPSPSPSSLSGSMSFLSSHHSDDYSLMMDTEHYAHMPSSPPYSIDSSSSSGSPPSSPSSSSTELPQSYISSSTTTSGPYLSRTSSSEHAPPPSSPSPSSSSSSTERPPPPRSGIRDMLDQLKDAADALSRDQASTNRMLDELANRPEPRQDTGVDERISRIEELLIRLLEQCQTQPPQPQAPPQPQPQPPAPVVDVDRESIPWSSSDGSDADSLWESIRRQRREQHPIHAPTPTRPGQHLVDQMNEMLLAGPQIPPPGVQAPVPLIPFTYQPGRPGRPRSISPVFEDILRRPATVPIAHDAFPLPRRRPARPPGILRAPAAGIHHPPGQTESRTSETPAVRPVVPGDDIDMARHVWEQRRQRDPNWEAQVYDPADRTEPSRSRRAPSAPPDLGAGEREEGPSWYRRRRDERPEQTMGNIPGGPGVVPPPGSFHPAGPAGPGPSFVPMPPGPTVVQVPLFDQMMLILRETRLAQMASIDQQRELMRYMTGLNEWLGRDVHDRQSEIRSVAARVDELRHDLGRLGMVQPPAPQVRIIPGESSDGSDSSSDESSLGDRRPSGPYPPGYPVYPQGPVIPPIVPPMQGPFAPQMPMPDPRPVIPSGPIPDMQQQQPYEYRPARRPSSSEEGELFIPPRPEQFSQPERITVVPPPPNQVPYVVQDQPTRISRSRSGSSRSRSRSSGDTLQGAHIVPMEDTGNGRSSRRSRSPRRRSSSREHSRSPSHGQPGGPTIIQLPAPQRSPSSRRSPSRRSSRRSSSPRRDERAQQPPPPSQTPQIQVIQPPVQQQPVAPISVIPGHTPERTRSSRSRRHSRSRSRSRSPTIYRLPSQRSTRSRSRTPPATVVIERPPSRPEQVVYPGTPARTEPPQVVIHEESRGRSRSRSHSRSPRGALAPVSAPPGVVVVPQATSHRSQSDPGRGHRRRHRSRSYSDRSYSPRRRHRSRRYSSRSRSRSRSPSRRHRYGRERRRSYSRSRSRTPEREDDRDRRHRRRSVSPRGKRRRSASPRERSESRESRRVSPRRSDRRKPRRDRTPSEERDGGDRGSPSRRSPSRVTHARPSTEHDGGATPGLGRFPTDPHRIIVPRVAGPPTVIEHGPDTGVPPHVEQQHTGPSGYRPQSPEDIRPIHDVREPLRRGESQVVPHRIAPSAEQRDEDEGQAPSRRPSRRAPTESIVEDEGELPERRPSVSVHRMPSSRRTQSIAPSGETDVVHIPPPSHAPADPEAAKRLRDEVEAAERELAAAARMAAENEENREDHFRKNEDERYRIFLENEARRDQEANERKNEIWQGLEDRLEEHAQRLGGQHPPGEPGAPAPGIPPETAESIKESIIDATRQAAGRHADDILDVVKQEREEMAKEREAAQAERERLHAEAEAERVRFAEEREARILALEAELASVREELMNEKTQRVQEENDARERERQEALERDEGVRNQLGDITNLVQDQRDCCTQKKELMEERWAEKQTRRVAKDNQMQSIFDMLAQMNEDREAERRRQEEERLAAEGKPGIEHVLEELHRQNAELREALNTLSDTWRADSMRQHEETINAVRATAQEQVPFNVQGYLDEFSKALASEVRMLLGEVGKLREEKRNLQHELGYLLCMKAKYGPGGEFDPDWKPTGPPPDAPPPEPPLPPEEHAPAKPAWRTFTPRASRKSKKPKEAPPPQAPPAPEPRTNSWAAWHPDPAMQPSPAIAEPNLLVPDMGSPGLFGPRSPSRSFRG